jgi:hypothetical protein
MGIIGELSLIVHFLFGANLGHSGTARGLPLVQLQLQPMPSMMTMNTITLPLAVYHRLLMGLLLQRPHNTMMTVSMPPQVLYRRPRLNRSGASPMVITGMYLSPGSLPVDRHLFNNFLRDCIGPVTAPNAVTTAAVIATTPAANLNDNASVTSSVEGFRGEAPLRFAGNLGTLGVVLATCLSIVVWYR